MNDFMIMQPLRAGASAAPGVRTMNAGERPRSIAPRERPGVCAGGSRAAAIARAGRDAIIPVLKGGRGGGRGVASVVLQAERRARWRVRLITRAAN
eukprot:scaffold1478_cov257-Prasinococcus_capsulatus_cf.AAC.1